MIQIAVADDHAVVREGIRQMMAKSRGITVGGEAANGVELLALLRTSTFDVLLVDLDMPGMSGPELIARLAKDYATTPIVVFSMYDDGPIVAQVIMAGASGYVTKGSPPEVLIEAIRKVASGGQHLDPAMVNALVFGRNVPALDGARQTLSSRELEILKMIADGRQLGDIADMLFLSPKTITTHKANMMVKLGVESNAALIRYAVKHGLTTD